MTIINQIKRLCFNINIKNRKGLHVKVLDDLKTLLAKDGFKVDKEYPIVFKSKIRRSGDIVSRHGYLDLFAVKNGWKIAIEFDTGVHLRFKSIEKLFQTNADLCIGIVKGKEKERSSLNVNIERIEQLKEEFSGIKTNILLIIMLEKIVLKV